MLGKWVLSYMLEGESTDINFLQGKLAICIYIKNLKMFVLFDTAVPLIGLYI